MALNILIVEARYHPGVAEALVDGATAALETGGARFERVSLPGVLEIPPAIAIAARGGPDFGGARFDGYLALGCVTGTDQPAHMLFGETTRALLAIAVGGVPVGHGIVLAPDEDIALEMAIGDDLGGDAARACLTLVSLGPRLGQRLAGSR